MTGKTHIAAGMCTSLAITYQYLHLSANPLGLAENIPLHLLPVGILCGIAGGLFPDIDWHTSKIGNALMPVSRVINMIFGHRTLFHSPILYVLLWLISHIWFRQYEWLSLTFLCGVGSHLLLDLMNAKGIPLLYPYSKHFHILKLKQNGHAETIIRKLCFGASVAFAIGVIFTAIIYRGVKPLPSAMVIFQQLGERRFLS